MKRSLIFLILLTSFFIKGEAKITPVSLRCEYLENPQVIDVLVSPSVMGKYCIGR